MKTFIKLSMMLAVLTVAVAANAQDLTITSTAIASNFATACASKGNDTEALITKAETAYPSLQGLLQQSSVVNDSQVFVPPTQFFNSCAYYQTFCTWQHHVQVCQSECVGAWQTTPGYYENNYRCDTTLSVNSPAYVLTLATGTPAQLDAAMDMGNVIYNEIDHDNARWVSVNQK